MHDQSILGTLARLRFAVGLLGEKAANGWWATGFLDPGSGAFLDPVFVRTSAAAKFYGVTEAARRVHDARLASGSFHLFRLPEESEQDLHALILKSRGGVPMPPDTSAAMSILEQVASGDGAASPGPKLLGSVSVIAERDSWQRAAAVYRDAFNKGFQSFPYFTCA